MHVCLQKQVTYQAALLYTPKTTVLIIVLINTNNKQSCCACVHGYHRLIQ